MRTKTMILVPLISTAVALTLNGMFHAGLMARYFDAAFAGFGNAVKPLKETSPGLLLLVEAIWVCVLFYFLSQHRPDTIRRPSAMLGGALMNLAVCSTWNFINLSMFRVYPAKIILPDLAWHVLIIGPVTGFIISALYNKFEAPKVVLQHR